ncbi:unnamed protein product [Peniophora sp. CBMAI 1063]|nr:unnamed protein product [Peniophora sp. CBMAI 1063]
MPWFATLKARFWTRRRTGSKTFLYFDADPTQDWAEPDRSSPISEYAESVDARLVANIDLAGSPVSPQDPNYALWWDAVTYRHGSLGSWGYLVWAKYHNFRQRSLLANAPLTSDNRHYKDTPFAAISDCRNSDAVLRALYDTLSLRCEDILSTDIRPDLDSIVNDLSRILEEFRPVTQTDRFPTLERHILFVAIGVLLNTPHKTPGHSQSRRLRMLFSHLAACTHRLLEYTMTCGAGFSTRTVVITAFVDMLDALKLAALMTRGDYDASLGRLEASTVRDAADVWQSIVDHIDCIQQDDEGLAVDIWNRGSWSDDDRNSMGEQLRDDGTSLILDGYDCEPDDQHPEEDEDWTAKDEDTQESGVEQSGDTESTTDTSEPSPGYDGDAIEGSKNPSSHNGQDHLATVIKSFASLPLDELVLANLLPVAYVVTRIQTWAESSHSSLLRLCASLTYYDQLRSATLDTHFECIHKQLMDEWKYVCGILAAVLAADVTVIGFSSGTVFTVDKLALRLVTLSEAAAAVGICIDGALLIRYYNATGDTFQKLAYGRVSKNYVFFAATSRFPLLCPCSSR